MKIAILLKKNQKEELPVLLITINEDQIESILNESLVNSETNYITLWLMKHQVQTLYVQDTDEETRSYYQKIGIAIKTYYELQQHPFFKSFII